jgi:hypothetical protein
MAEGFAAAEANQLLDALIAEYPFIQLHNAAPGAAGTTGVAAGGVRRDWSAAFLPAAAGAAVTDVDLDWTDGEVDAAEDYTHWSAWTLSSGGVFGFSGDINPDVTVAATGNAFRIPAGNLTISLTVAT